MLHCDATNADLFRLTRLHRYFLSPPIKYAEETGNSFEARSAREPVRYAGASFEYVQPHPGYGKSGPSRARVRKSSRFIRTLLWARGHRSCCYCKRQLMLKLGQSNTLTLEHKQPLSLGGAHSWPNFAAACSPCNNEKGSMTEAEYRALLASR